VRNFISHCGEEVLRRLLGLNEGGSDKYYCDEIKEDETGGTL
jgi:hypothetical protein